MALVFWAIFGAFPGCLLMSVALTAKGTKLDDGTMVVVEAGSELIGLTQEVEIFSVTRTAIGRMLFGRPIA